MFRGNNKDTRATSGVFIVNFEHVIAGWVSECFSKWFLFLSNYFFQVNQIRSGFILLDFFSEYDMLLPLPL